MKLKLGILDQSPVISGSNSLTALNNSIDLAIFADEAGFHNVMYSEHHGIEAYGSSSPELLAAVVLGRTKKIRVGTGGIMLRNYSAYKIAEWTKMLSTLYPGRFILGLGKAPGGLKDAVQALNSNKPPVLSNMVNRLEEIIQYIKDEEGVYRGLIAQPKELIHPPEIIWLGSGMTSASEAAGHGVGYSFADFMRNGNETESTEAYLREFDNSRYGKVPSLQIAVAASVAEDIHKAGYNAYGMAYQFLQARHLEAPEALLPSEQIRERIMGTEYEEEFFRILDKIIIDTPANISERLKETSEKYNTDNILILCNMYREEDRMDTYKSIILNNR